MAPILKIFIKFVPSLGKETTMPSKSFVLATIVAACGCGLLGLSGSGACLTPPVEYSFGLIVYCYTDWEEEECSEWNDERVNGSEWIFHSGQTCEDRGLEDGSNDWP